MVILTSLPLMYCFNKKARAAFVVENAKEKMFSFVIITSFESNGTGWGSRTIQ